MALAEVGYAPAGTYISVNASQRVAMHPGLLDLLDEAPVERLVVEITEHEAVEDYDALTSSLQVLRARGVRIAIDDAGAGFSSLRHTLRLAPDIVKLDISITRDIDSDRGRRALASAMISFADEMDMAIVAEGVETGGRRTASCRSSACPSDRDTCSRARRPAVGVGRRPIRTCGDRAPRKSRPAAS